MRNAAEKKRIGKGTSRAEIHSVSRYIYIYIYYILLYIYTCGKKRILCNLMEPGLN